MILLYGVSAGFSAAVHAAPSCDSTWPHALNVHGTDGQIDHKGEAWGLDTNASGEALLGAQPGKVNDKGDCYDTDNNLASACVGDEPAVSLGAPDFLEPNTPNPPDELVASDTTYTSDREFGSLTVTNGATLTLSGPIRIAIESNGGLTIDEDATVRVEDIESGEVVTVSAPGKFDLHRGNVEIASPGTLEVRAGDFTANAGSDLNCGPVENPGPTGKRTCGDSDGGLFVHSGSGINLDNSIARGVFYGDGNEGRLQNQAGTGFATLLQGAWTSGQVNTQPGTDIVAGEVPQQTLCNSGGPHYAVLDPGSGLTCEALEVTIEAHDEDDNPIAPSDDTAIEVTAVADTNNANPTWSNGSDTITYDFDGTETEETLSLTVDRNATVNIDVVEQRGTGTEKSPAEDPDIAFSGNALVFDTAIGPQIAGKPSHVSPDAQSLGLKALKCEKNGSTSDLFSGDREVEWAVECLNPSDASASSVCPNSARSLELDTEAVSSPFSADLSAPSNQQGQVDDYRQHTEDFDGSVVAFALRYPDAGKIRLHARACTQKNKAPSNCSSNKLITGQSNAFVVRPFGFGLDFDPDGDGIFDDRANNAGCTSQQSCSADANGDVFATAATDFSVALSAVLWEAGDDTDSTEGRPDSNETILDNALAPSFGHEDTPETVDLSPVLAAPTPGDAGTLSGSGAVGDFSDGSTVVTGVAWDEVGIIDLDAALSGGSYLGSADVTGAVADVGRFIPADFAVSVRDAGMYAATCAGTFSYVGEAFGYDLGPMLDITARNAGGATTVNYRGNFIQLTGGDVDVTPPTSDASAIGNVSGTTDVAVTPSLNTGAVADDGDGDALGNGVVVYTFDGGDTYTYDKVHNARIDAFTADLPITVDDVTDADGVTDASLPSPNPFTPTGVEIRFGRLVIDDAFGPEVAPVEQRWRIESWQGTNWATNTADGCTSLGLNADVELDGDGGTSPGDATVTLNDSGGTGTTAIVDNALDVTSGSIVFTGGAADVRYSAPGEGERGWIGVASALGSDHGHLLVDDNDDGGNDGPYDADPGARVTFGVFAGESENIYLREVFPAP